VIGTSPDGEEDAAAVVTHRASHQAWAAESGTEAAVAYRCHTWQRMYVQSSNVVMSDSTRRTNFKAGSMRTRWTGTQMTWPQHWIIWNGSAG
jgi:hypothetical protein